MSVGLLETEAASVPMSAFSPFGLEEQSLAGKLQTSMADIAERLYRQLNEIVGQAAAMRTVRDFHAYREGIYQVYVDLSIALSKVILAKLDETELPSIIQASFEAIEAQFAARAPLNFGDDAHREIMFSVSTLKSAYRLLPTIAFNDLAENLRQQDMELANKFTAAVMWSNFHLYALQAAMMKDQIIVPEVLQELLEGLRLSLMAYAHVREALDLRNILTDRYSEGLTVSWDEEDEALANAD